MQLDHIYQGDCREVLAGLPEKSVDVVFADPPYNLQLRNELRRPNMTIVDAVDDKWDQFSDFAAYDQFTHEWLSECKRVLKDTGTIWTIGSYHNIYRVGKVLQDLGYWILNDVVWIKCLAGNTELYCLINDRPLISNLKDLARIDPSTNSIKLPSFDDTGKFTWTDVVGMAQTEKTHGVRVLLEDGSWVESTKEHKFPVLRGGLIEYVEAAKLACNDILLQLRKFELPYTIPSEGMDYDLGEFIGWFIAEGSFHDNHDGLQLALSIDEMDVAAKLLSLIRNRFGVVGRTHTYGNCIYLNFSSRFIVSLVERFVSGGTAKTKRLTREALFYGLDFVHGIFAGYLKGDGHWDDKNQRWRLGLCRNEGLITDLSVIARLIDHRLRFTFSHIPYKRGQAEIIRGSVRDNRDLRWSFVRLEDLGLPTRRSFSYGQNHSISAMRNLYKLSTRKNPDGSISDSARQILYGDLQPVRISQVLSGTLRHFYDVAVSGNHVFALANGLLTHNSNPMPNFRGVRFTNAHETLLWCKKTAAQKKYTFNYHAMKSMNEGKQMRSDWELALATGAERLRAGGEKVHTTQKPEALLYRVILSSSNPGDVVLDPFFGTGTSGAVAKKLGRHYIGIETEAAYIRAAKQRLEAIPAPRLDDEALGKYHTKRSSPRLPFSALLEHGLLLPGQTVYFDRNKHAFATILADGSLRAADGARGSIHQIGAAVANLPACNGWEHWYYEDDAGELVVLDALREMVRKTIHE